jgi:hypothetical protein
MVVQLPIGSNVVWNVNGTIRWVSCWMIRVWVVIGEIGCPNSRVHDLVNIFKYSGTFYFVNFGTDLPQIGTVCLAQKCPAFDTHPNSGVAIKHYPVPFLYFRNETKRC